MSTKQKISRKCKKSKKSGTFRDLGEAHAQYFFHPPHFQRVLEVFPQLLKQVGPRRVRSAKVRDPKTDMCLTIDDIAGLNISVLSRFKIPIKKHIVFNGDPP